jgi:hypothetical protein
MPDEGQRCRFPEPAKLKTTGTGSSHVALALDYIAAGGEGEYGSNDLPGELGDRIGTLAQ